ncbi:conjugative transfer protein MobI(A/C) [Psychromonas aquimarina]|uniref:conjugative transfer protein MobI(A/C) n=1 Tax=Psychromonas aquimarina TaxID=444919 RepID=UPI00048C6119|nr:conjugative transfer protein MobI(A/C) [Psychromonas aquimarina]
MKSAHTELKDKLYSVIDSLYIDTVMYQEMWMAKIAKRELSLSDNDYKNNQAIKYQLRVEFSGSGFIIRWLTCKFVRNNSKVIRLTKAIAIPRNGMYSKDKFKDASEWELALILELENILGPIRNQLKHLMKCHISLRNASKAIGEKFDAIDIKHRVEIPTASIKGFKEKYR